METITYKRFRSGDLCDDSGWYEFDGYVDAREAPLPGLSEMEIPMIAGDVFPPVRGQQRACYWKHVDGLGAPLTEDEQTPPVHL
jgi:hypothetical protein